MRLFQNSGISASYARRLRGLTAGVTGFEAQRTVFLNDRYGAAHFLKPVYGAPDAFFTNGDDENLQRAWAREQGMAGTPLLADILLAQIEHHRTEILYNLDPTLYDAAFIKRLPGHVRRKIAWRAAPGTIDFTGYDLVVSNFPSIRAAYERQGLRTAEFFPSHDPELDACAERTDRDIDILFIGGFSRHHARRAGLLEAVAGLSERCRVVFHLDRSRYTALAETPLGWFGPLAKVRRPKAVRQISQPPVFGRDMYGQLGRARIIFNAAIDMAGQDRGNMRCFEAMGAGACLVTDEGVYPPGMADGETMITYRDAADAVAKLEAMLDEPRRAPIAAAGAAMLRQTYSKDRQMSRFTDLVS